VTIDAHFAVHRVIEAHEQLQQRRFAGSSRANQRERLARFGLEAHVLQHEALGLPVLHICVAEVDVVVLDVARWVLELDGVLDLRNLGGISISPKIRSQEALAFSYWSTMFDTCESGVTNRWVMNRNVMNSPAWRVP